jgi:hypothetical protein
MSIHTEFASAVSEERVSTTVAHESGRPAAASSSRIGAIPALRRQTADRVRQHVQHQVSVYIP